MEVIVKMKNLNGWNRLFIVLSSLWLLASIFLAPTSREFGNNYWDIEDNGFYQNKLSEKSKSLIISGYSFSNWETGFSAEEYLRSEQKEATASAKPSVENDKHKWEEALRVVSILEFDTGGFADYAYGENLNLSSWKAEFPNHRGMIVKKGVTFNQFIPLAKEYKAILEHAWNLKNFYWWLTWLVQGWIAPLVFIYFLGASLAWVWRGFRAAK